MASSMTDRVLTNKELDALERVTTRTREIGGGNRDEQRRILFVIASHRLQAARIQELEKEKRDNEGFAQND